MVSYGKVAWAALSHAKPLSRLSVRNICCNAEVRLIKRIVEPMKGVDNVSVNPFSKICTVDPWISSVN